MAILTFYIVAADSVSFKNKYRNNKFLKIFQNLNGASCALLPPPSSVRPNLVESPNGTPVRWNPQPIPHFPHHQPTRLILISNLIQSIISYTFIQLRIDNQHAHF